MTINEVTGQIVDAAMKVHTALGPGLLESAYQSCLQFELQRHGLDVQAQVELPVIYDNVRIDVGYRLDLLVNGIVVVELKSVDKLTPLHHVHGFSYLRLSKLNVGLLINFNVLHLKDGIVRIVNKL